MSTYKTIVCDQFNVNDKDYTVVELSIPNGAGVKKGDSLMALDSSKALIDIESEADGFFYTLNEVGKPVSVGQVLYILSDGLLTNQDLQEIFSKQHEYKLEPVVTTHNKVVTKKAEALIREHNIDITRIADEVITEDVVKREMSLLTSHREVVPDIRSNFGLVRRIAFIGAGQGLIQALDIVLANSNLMPVFIYDDTPSKRGTTILGISVRDSVDPETILSDFQEGLFDAIINTVSTSISFRKKIFDQLTERSVPFANLIHPSAYVGMNCAIGRGNIILAKASLGAYVQIGDDNFISAQCNIEHHNKIESHCTFGPGVMTSGNVTIGGETKFGTGIFIEPNVSIGKKSIVSSGCIITRNVPADTTVYNGNNKISFKSNNS
jgi:sugar O-acyltransferase (sialic acid O-acetyltransferase NeuD family)